MKYFYTLLFYRTLALKKPQTEVTCVLEEQRSILSEGSTLTVSKEFDVSQGFGIESREPFLLGETNRANTPVISRSIHAVTYNVQRVMFPAPDGNSQGSRILAKRFPCPSWIFDPLCRARWSSSPPLPHDPAFHGSLAFPA